MTGASPGGSFADEAFAVAADAYLSAPGWERGLQIAIGHLFLFLAEHPDRTNACIVADAEGGPAALSRRDRLIERFAELLRPGFERAEGGPRPPEVVGEAIGGGIYEMVRAHVLERRLGDLPAAAPHATVLALSPFVGPADAAKLATTANMLSANVQTKR
jgi:hypothetical protein